MVAAAYDAVPAAVRWLLFANFADFRGQPPAAVVFPAWTFKAGIQGQQRCPLSALAVDTAATSPSKNESSRQHDQCGLDQHRRYHRAVLLLKFQGHRNTHPCMSADHREYWQPATLKFFAKFLLECKAATRQRGPQAAEPFTARSLLLLCVSDAQYGANVEWARRHHLTSCGTAQTQRAS